MDSGSPTKNGSDWQDKPMPEIVRLEKGISGDDPEFLNHPHIVFSQKKGKCRCGRRRITVKLKNGRGRAWNCAGCKKNVTVCQCAEVKP